MNPCVFCDPGPCDCEDGGLPFESFGEEWPPWVPRQVVDEEVAVTGMTERDELLIMTLQATVPLLVLELNGMRQGARLALIEDWRQPHPAIYCRGDQIQFPCRPVKPRAHPAGDGGSYTTPGQEGTAIGFSILARAVAALSFHQGGLRAFGLLWCAEHSCSGTRTDQHGCARCLEQYPRAPAGCPCCEHLIEAAPATGGLT